MSIVEYMSTDDAPSAAASKPAPEFKVDFTMTLGTDDADYDVYWQINKQFNNYDVYEQMDQKFVA